MADEPAPSPKMVVVRMNEKELELLDRLKEATGLRTASEVVRTALRSLAKEQNRG